jgi:hypothetical protein
VLQRIQLLVNFCVDLVVAMAHAHRHDAAQEIQVLIAIRIPEVLILGARNHQRLLIEVEDRGKQKLLIGKNNFVFGHGSCLYECFVHVGTPVAEELPGLAHFGDLRRGRGW